MSEALADDVRALRAALEGSRDKVSVTLELPRKSAEKVLALLDAELYLAGDAKAQSGEIEHVKVGTHHRIPAEAILAFQRDRKARRDKAAEALADFSDEIGFVD